MNKSNLIIFVVALVAMLSGIWVYQQQRGDFYDLDETAYRWSQLNQETLIVNYFAEWCAPCIKEIPELNALHDWIQQQPKITFIAVSYDALSSAELDELRRKYDMQFALVAEPGEHFPIAKPNFLPSTFIVNKGVLHGPLLGEQTFQTLKNAIEEVMSEH